MKLLISFAPHSLLDRRRVLGDWKSILFQGAKECLAWGIPSLALSIYPACHVGWAVVINTWLNFAGSLCIFPYRSWLCLAEPLGPLPLFRPVDSDAKKAPTTLAAKEMRRSRPRIDGSLDFLAIKPSIDIAIVSCICISPQQKALQPSNGADGMW